MKRRSPLSCSLTEEPSKKLFSDEDLSLHGYTPVPIPFNLDFCPYRPSAPAPLTPTERGFGLPPLPSLTSNLSVLVLVRKAIELNRTVHLGRRIRVGIAHERGEYSSNKSNWSKSILKSEIGQPTESSKSLQHHDKEIEGKPSGFLCESSRRLPTLEEQNCPSKTINVRNLSYRVERADMENFFQRCGKIVDVCLRMDHKGRFNGFGQVVFATAEAAMKAVDLNNTEWLRRHIRVDLAKGKGEHAHSRSNWSNLFQKCERDQSPIIYVRGFCSSLPIEKIKASLEEHFGSCGAIARISIPKHRESGDVKGFAHLEFNHFVCVNKALHLDQSELGGYRLRVEKAKPQRENQGIGGGRSGGCHKFGGRDGSDCSSKVGWGRSGGGGWHSLHISAEGTECNGS
ncbi:hypothetical protein V8G54_001226 [Vigna mungo]|uniref:RRM domain-containing protein n=1 Tax=Vigna mungo TaxID=3915 RepID=A0AAQ3S9Q9_VIGMU